MARNDVSSYAGRAAPPAALSRIRLKALRQAADRYCQMDDTSGGHSAIAAAASVGPAERLVGMGFANPAFVLAEQAGHQTRRSASWR